MNWLDAQLLAAHDAQDQQSLVDLYAQAAQCADDDNARSFYLTHAYVFALELGAPAATELRQMLIDMGREAPI